MATRTRKQGRKPDQEVHAFVVRLEPELYERLVDRAHAEKKSGSGEGTLVGIIRKSLERYL